MRNIFTFCTLLLLATWSSAVDITPDLKVTPKPAIAQETVAFDASGSSSANGIVEYQFDFGDGQSEITTNPITNHIYGQAGSYEITLTVVDAGGQQETSNIQSLDIAAGITIDVHLDPSSPELSSLSGGGGNLQAIARTAADYWAEAFGDEHALEITVVVADLPNLGDAVVTTTDGNGRATAVTITVDSGAAWYLDPTPWLPDNYFGAFADTHDFGGGILTTAEGRSSGTHPDMQGRIDLLTLMLHEVGHAVGLNGTVSEPLSVNAPRPFAGSVLPTSNTVGAHLSPTVTELTNALMREGQPPTDDGRLFISEVDVIAVAEQAGYEIVRFPPNALSAPMATIPTPARNPISATITAGASVQFTAGFDSLHVPTLQWEVSTDGGQTWTDQAGGTTSTLRPESTLTLATTDAILDGNQYRLRATTGAGSDVTTAAALSVRVPASQTFDNFEGYQLASDLIGQNGWTGSADPGEAQVVAAALTYSNGSIALSGGDQALRIRNSTSSSGETFLDRPLPNPEDDDLYISFLVRNEIAALPDTSFWGATTTNGSIWNSWGAGHTNNFTREEYFDTTFNRLNFGSSIGTGTTHLLVLRWIRVNDTDPYHFSVMIDPASESALPTIDPTDPTVVPESLTDVVLRTLSSDADYLVDRIVVGNSFAEVTAPRSGPSAVTGPDRTVADSDGLAGESVTLDGSGSSDDGGIVGYTWTENGSVIATGMTPTIILSDGSHQIDLEVTDDDGARDLASLQIEVAAPPAGQTTFNNGGLPWSIDGSSTLRIEAEDYDTGGEGIGYHDTTSGNSGGAYRSDDVDVQGTADAGGGHNVGWISNGEWLEYTVEVAQSGTYLVDLRVARKPTGDAALHLEIEGSDLTGAVVVPSTGGWQTWTTVSASVDLAAGEQVLRLAMDASSFNVNWIEIAPAPTADDPPIADLQVSATNVEVGQTVTFDASASSDDIGIATYEFDAGDGTLISSSQAVVDHVYAAAGTYQVSLRVVDTIGQDHASSAQTVDVSNAATQATFGNGGLPWALSTNSTVTIEAENYDVGGEGVAYHDRKGGNTGGAYRNDDVDLEVTGDNGGGHNVGWIRGGEWLEYTIDVPQAGTYTVDVRVARQPTGDSSLHLEVGGTDLSGSIAVPSTGGWQNWTTVNVDVELQAGEQVLRVAMDQSGLNLNWMTFALTPINNG